MIEWPNVSQTFPFFPNCISHLKRRIIALDNSMIPFQMNCEIETNASKRHNAVGTELLLDKPELHLMIRAVPLNNLSCFTCSALWHSSMNMKLPVHNKFTQLIKISHFLSNSNVFLNAIFPIPIHYTLRDFCRKCSNCSNKRLRDLISQDYFWQL